MLSEYLIPTVSSLPLGFDCILPISEKVLARRVHGREGSIIHRLRVFHEGKIIEEEARSITFKNGVFENFWLEAFKWSYKKDLWRHNPGFLESEFRIEEGDIRFYGKAPMAFYAVYSATGKKGFLSDNAYKFSSPPIISQIAAYGRFVETYSVIRIDQPRDYGDSLILINPYNKAILCTLVTMDGRQMPRLRVPALSARYMNLEGILKDGENKWEGEIQLTANNRLIVYDLKHALSDITIVSDHEHLDPFRGDPTHLPFFQWCRASGGEFLSHRLNR